MSAMLMCKIIIFKGLIELRRSYTMIHQVLDSTTMAQTQALSKDNLVRTCTISLRSESVYTFDLLKAPFSASWERDKLA